MLRDSKINKYLFEFKNYIANKELDTSIKFDKPPPLKLSYSNMPKDTHHFSSSNSSFGFNFFSEFKSPMSSSKDLFNSQIWHQNPIDLPSEELFFLPPPKESIELLPERSKFLLPPPKESIELLPERSKFLLPPPKESKFLFPPQPMPPPPRKFKQRLKPRPNYLFKYLKYKLKYLRLREILN
jgi:hypothetical protein